MYLPAHFAENDPQTLRAFIDAHPLATLVSNGPNGPDASHIPMLLDPAGATLRCHLARANTHWQSLQNLSVLAIFGGPSHYISPNWYASKKEHGKVVPTWNYVTVHARGTATIFEDEAALIQLVTALTNQHEAAQANPWRVTDAPAGYIQNLTKAIVGVEIRITSLEGKWKLSQNRPQPDQTGVMEGLEESQSPNAHEIAQLMRDRTLK